MLYFPVAFALLFCLIPGIPYGYFILVRLLATVAFSVMAHQYYMRRKDEMMWMLITLALLFQPFAKVGLGRTIWNIIDVVVAIGLTVLFFREKKGGRANCHARKACEQIMLGKTSENN